MSFIGLSELQIEELAKCYNNPIYFIENYCWIEIKETRKIVPAKLFPYQKKILQWLIDGENGLVLKSRRVGGSTVVALYLAWLINFRRGVNALLLSETEDKAKKLLLKVKFSLFNIRKHTSEDYILAEDCSWMRNEVVINNQQLLAVGWLDDSGNVTSTSEVASLTTTSNSGRGDSATFVFMDEMAFLEDQEGVMRSALLTTTRGGSWIAVSTPNGVGDRFHSLCMRAERKENKGYNFLKVHWSEAEMTQNMIDTVSEGLSDSSIAQEMEMVFLSSGDPVFNPIHLDACYRPIDLYGDVKRELDEYREKVILSRGEFCYYSGVDSAIGKLSKRGGKRDYHAFTTLTRSGIQAYTYYDKEMELLDWAGNIEQVAGKSIVKTGKVSNLHKEYPGVMYIEGNGPGQAVYINHETPDDGFSYAVAKQTTHKSKEQIIRQLILAVESHSIVITDRFTYDCMNVFQRGATPGVYNAPAGDYYDDVVIALAYAWDALLRSGTVEFSWGQTTDNLVYNPRSADQIDNIELSNMGFGPSLLNNISPTERLSNLFHNGTAIMVDSDLSLDKIKEPVLDVI